MGAGTSSERVLIYKHIHLGSSVFGTGIFTESSSNAEHIYSIHSLGMGGALIDLFSSY